MQKVDMSRMEMIRSREKNGFYYTNKSFTAESVASIPSTDDLAKLVEEKWWDSPAAMGGFVNAHNGQISSPTSRLRIVYDKEYIFAAFLMDEPQMDKTHALVTEPGTRNVEFQEAKHVHGLSEAMIPYAIDKDDSIELMLDATHSHKRYIRFFMNLAGVHFAEECEYVYHWSQVYTTNTFLQTWAMPYETGFLKGRDFWCSAFKIPWASLRVDHDVSVLMGVNARRSRTVKEWNKHMLVFSPDIGACAFDFGDLYLGRNPIEVPEVDFGFPVFDENTFAIKLKNTSPDRLELTCSANLTGEASSEPLCRDQADISLNKGETGSVKLAYTPDECDTHVQVLNVTIRQKSGPDVYRGQYFLSRLSWIMLENRYDWPCAQPAPSPDDSCFLKKKRNYLLSRIPKFYRVTTVDGAPSDFTLRSVCGKYEFNLMRQGELKRIADMLNDLFADADDRLAACCLLAHQRSFSTHMSQQAALHTQISSLSALRLNAGHCYSRALVWLGIAQHVKRQDGSCYGEHAHAYLVLGHVIGAIDIGDDDRYLFDPTHGALFYRWDNQGFATEKEIEADLTLVDRVLHGRRHQYDHVEFHRAIPAGQIVFPQGAPSE